MGGRWLKVVPAFNIELCERFGVSNAQRTVHGALLDAQLLAEVYLAMTRGQESLTIDMVSTGNNTQVDVQGRISVDEANFAIEGLEGNRFALFIKIHHALIDGVSGMKLLQRSMSPDRARSVRMPPFWASKAL